MKIVNIIFYILSSLLLLMAAFDVGSFGLLFLAPVFFIRGIIEIFNKK